MSSSNAAADPPNTSAVDAGGGNLSTPENVEPVHSSSSNLIAQLGCREVLQWWGRSGKKMFPSITPVAQQVFGNQAAAAQIERDFSACGNLLTKSRSRMDTFWVELMMFCKANFDLIPALKNIPIVAAKDIRKCLPACFKGDKTDLLAAEASFDVLNNTAIPTEDYIDLDG